MDIEKIYRMHGTDSSEVVSARLEIEDIPLQRRDMLAMKYSHDVLAHIEAAAVSCRSQIRRGEPLDNYAALNLIIRLANYLVADLESQSESGGFEQES
jgi:hypothetical protein